MNYLVILKIFEKENGIKKSDSSRCKSTASETNSCFSLRVKYYKVLHT